jgi:hypothetical protein
VRAFAASRATRNDAPRGIEVCTERCRIRILKERSTPTNRSAEKEHHGALLPVARRNDSDTSLRPTASGRLELSLAFGFAMGADYMLIPLVTAECFGTASVGKLLALIIVGYSLGQWGAPWITGKIFDAHHTYALAWGIMAAAGVLGAAAIYAVSIPEDKSRT